MCACTTAAFGPHAVRCYADLHNTLKTCETCQGRPKHGRPARCWLLRRSSRGFRGRICTVSVGDTNMGSQRSTADKSGYSRSFQRSNVLQTHCSCRGKLVIGAQVGFSLGAEEEGADGETSVTSGPAPKALNAAAWEAPGHAHPGSICISGGKLWPFVAASAAKLRPQTGPTAGKRWLQRLSRRQWRNPDTHTRIHTHPLCL